MYPKPLHFDSRVWDLNAIHPGINYNAYSGIVKRDVIYKTHLCKSQWIYILGLQIMERKGHYTRMCDRVFVERRCLAGHKLLGRALFCNLSSQLFAGNATAMSVISQLMETVKESKFMHTYIFPFFFKKKKQSKIDSSGGLLYTSSLRLIWANPPRYGYDKPVHSLWMTAGSREQKCILWCFRRRGDLITIKPCQTYSPPLQLLSSLFPPQCLFSLLPLNTLETSNQSLKKKTLKFLILKILVCIHIILIIYKQKRLFTYHKRIIFVYQQIVALILLKLISVSSTEIKKNNKKSWLLTMYVYRLYWIKSCIGVHRIILHQTVAVSQISGVILWRSRGGVGVPGCDSLNSFAADRNLGKPN
ncbi:hypothetical protein VP01_802g1 [Puccinia sorghi]|uniref:Uncharacterized protein n=1 Tax=Puccinia sorghi TaxID=27349 RepID=A0A0L6UAH8_9BASI|nr:hypothetical protein VP01_802g1 [Puccinia sorghi]